MSRKLNSAPKWCETFAFQPMRKAQEPQGTCWVFAEGHPRERVMQRRHGSVSTHARSRKGAHHHQNHVMMVSWTRLLWYTGMICFVGTRVEQPTHDPVACYSVSGSLWCQGGANFPALHLVFSDNGNILIEYEPHPPHAGDHNHHQCEHEQATGVSAPSVQKPLGEVLAKFPKLDPTSTRFPQYGDESFVSVAGAFQHLRFSTMELARGRHVESDRMLVDHLDCRCTMFDSAPATCVHLR